MPPPPDDDESNDTPPAAEQGHQEHSSTAPEEQTTDRGTVAEEDTNAYTSPTEEKIKSVKAGLGLVGTEGDKKKIREAKEGVKAEAGKGESEEEDSVPPALPPRPPPRPRQTCSCTCVLDEGDVPERNDGRVPRYCWANGLRKYVFLCSICGSLSILLGALFLIVYFALKSYTTSLNHFETIPTYVPSGMLIATGFLIVCLACRKNRNSFLMKMCGLCSLCCAVLCVSVTVTTTVIHMNRLQTLRECLYTLKTQSCTCYSVIVDNDRISDEGIKFVFNSTPDCEVIHGALYSCLRAIFGLSVIGILVCIFSCMLVYQLLSHEKKKMYWAQLEMRCRYLYRQQRSPYWCEECRFPAHSHELFPWDLMGNRFWSTGRTGNLYTPNPEERGNASRLRSGWNWRRLPWSRTGTNTNEPNRANLNSPDSQYGFSSTPAVDGMPYTVLDSRTHGDLSSGHTVLPPGADIAEGFYSWGPPPPYASNRNSANNSPARRSLGDILHQVSPIRRNDNVSPARALHHSHRHHLHHNRQCTSVARQAPKAATFHKATAPLQPITSAIQQQQNAIDTLWSNRLSSMHRFQKVVPNKANYENIYESEGVLPSDGFNTLPSLKRRTQPRVGDIFQNDTSVAYFFSSAENLAYSDGNAPSGENPPLRRILKNPYPNSTRYVPSTTQNFSYKSHNEAMVGNSPSQYQSDGNTQTSSLARKVLVNNSPSKQKTRQEEQTARQKVGREDDMMTFHYRADMPKSGEVQNFLEKSEEEDDSNDPQNEPEHELEVLSKSTKYITKDVDLLQKHKSLMKEFRRNLDSHKYRTDSGNDLKRRQHYPTDEDYYPALQKPIENESDVYFGDISNSSYNDGLEYEETIEEEQPVASYSVSGHHVLSQQNLKIMESETSPYDQRDDSVYARQSYRHRSKFLPPEQPSHTFNPHDTSTQDPYIKSPRRLYPHYNEPKYFPQEMHPYHQQEFNDELSSGSLTADSGISTGRNFIGGSYDSGYHDVGTNVPEPPPKDDISALDFSHPLFQKPKILPRGRYREIDSRQNFDLEESDSVSDGDKRKWKTTEEAVTLTPMEEQAPPLEDNDPPLQEEPFPARTSPKPLPRASKALGEAQGQGYRHMQATDYIAPDAQYEFQEPLKGVLKTPGKGKPAVPARPLSLQGAQKKGGKGGGNEGGETGSHSVNV